MYLQLFARKKKPSEGVKDIEDSNELLRETTEDSESLPEEIPEGAGRETVATDNQLNNITTKDIAAAEQTLIKYKNHKSELERRIRQNEEWWRLRHWAITASEEERREKHMSEPVSAWLHNSINNKHADIMDNYPEPIVLPREESDDESAKTLTSILPVVLEYNKYEQAYSDAAWYKLKQGCSAKIVAWNPRKNRGLGDIDVRRVDLLNLFWEPGISDIQESENIFHVQLVNNSVLKARYPDIEFSTGEGNLTLTKYVYEDSIDVSEKTAVIDWYYKKDDGSKDILHYVKFAGGQILYASENDPIYVDKGFYDHGKYPFVFDKLFIEEGSPAGFGYIDIMKDPQMYIDKLNQVILDTSVKASKARYFIKAGAGVNEEEFNDWTKETIHYSGNPDDILPFQPVQVPSVNENILQSKIDELKETSGNRDFSQGSTQSGVTAATAIAALQEAGSKLSRDMIRGTYRAFGEECELVIELIRQFYTTPRQFRILGDKGQQEFVSFSNEGLRPQNQGEAFGVDLGQKEPIFDVSINTAKKSTYSRMSQNELALQFYDKGFFMPGNADATLSCLDMMDFDGKEKIVQRVESNGTLYQMNMMLQQQIAMLQARLGMQPQIQGMPQGVQPQGGSGSDVDMDTLGGARPRSERLEGAKAQAKGMAEI